MKKTLISALLLAALFPGCSSSSVTSPVDTPANSMDIPGLPFPLPSTLTREEFQPRLGAFLDSLSYRTLPGWRRDGEVRDTGPFIDGVYYGTHPAVVCYYSPEVYAWLKAGRPGELPDGAMIIKEMYTPPAARYAGLSPDQLPPPTWTCMIKDKAGAHDGWYWSYYQTGQPVDSNAPPFSYPNSTFGAYCLQCHTSADGEFTFASLDNIEGEPGEPLTYFDDGSWKTMKNYQFKFMGHIMGKDHGDTSDVIDDALPPPGPDFVNPEFVAQFASLASAVSEKVEPIPGVTTDHSVARTHRQFVSSDQCLPCHSGDSSPFGPNLFYPDILPDGVDVSPFAEWSWSMMGLAGRDPIFHAQLESERALHSANGEYTPESIQNLCFTCHGVMGERQLKLDDPNANLLQSMVEDPHDQYGKLARDGVSCALCHQIADYSNVPLTSVQTGAFPLEPRTPDGKLTINGPYDDVATLPMEKSINAHPKGNAFVKSSVLCASCHTVFLPVLDANNNVVDSKYEQSTFLEWANSSFRDDGPTPRSCQDCHMPDDYYGQKTDNFKIANIQDQTYPFTSHLSPIAAITVIPRPKYRRHVLLGINQFALEMFQKFPNILGVSKVNFMSGTVDGLTRAIENSQDLAVNQSATVELLSSQRAGNVLTSVVKVTNLTGHRFPSGVGFRRAFLAFEVKDGAGNVVWHSGRTNGVGVILGANNQELTTEFHQNDSFEPHYTLITSENQVQIFEEVNLDLQGHVTTSFLSRASQPKDNRLMPLGWTFPGPPGFPPAFAEATEPEGSAANDPDFVDGTGSDTLTYQATLPSGAVGPFTVSARLYYQSIPPYYLQDRFTQSQGPATKRLYHISAKLDTRQTNFPDWKLPIDDASAQVP